jgi:acyl-coenzyme A thioesterase PaaI-like protein
MQMAPQNPAFAETVAQSFAQQPIMNLIGARLGLVEPGVVEIILPYRSDLTQQHGYLHAGVVTTIADSACGYAAYSLMPAGFGSFERRVQSEFAAAGARQIVSRARGSD